MSEEERVYIYSDAVCRDRPEVSVAADEMLHTTTEVYTFFPCISTGERVLFSLSLSPPVAADEMLHATTEVSVAASRKKQALQATVGGSHRQRDQ